MPPVGFPKFKSKRPVRSYTTNCVNGNIVLQNGKLKLPKAGWVHIRQHRKIEEGYQLKAQPSTRKQMNDTMLPYCIPAREAVYEIKKQNLPLDLIFL